MRFVVFMFLLVLAAAYTDPVNAHDILSSEPVAVNYLSEEAQVLQSYETEGMSGCCASSNAVQVQQVRALRFLIDMEYRDGDREGNFTIVPEYPWDPNAAMYSDPACSGTITMDYHFYGEDVYGSNVVFPIYYTVVTADGETVHGATHNPSVVENICWGYFTLVNEPIWA